MWGVKKHMSTTLKKSTSVNKHLIIQYFTLDSCNFDCALPPKYGVRENTFWTCIARIPAWNALGNQIINWEIWIMISNLNYLIT